MAVYGVGAYYNRAISSDFINQNLAGVDLNYRNTLDP